jgi:signal-transduction protein with cAMP-binding, CBS, and nucleotidyltransferase domain
MDRLDALRDAGVLSEASHAATASAYDLLMRLRLRHQHRLFDQGKETDNVVPYRSLTHIEWVLLDEAFGQIAAIQKRVQHDFFGGADTE